MSRPCGFDEYDLSEAEFEYALKLSNMWKFEAVKRAAISRLESFCLGPARIIQLARLYDVAYWIESLTVQELRQVGIDIASEIIAHRDMKTFVALDSAKDNFSNQEATREQKRSAQNKAHEIWTPPNYRQGTSNRSNVREALNNSTTAEVVEQQRKANALDISLMADDVLAQQRISKTVTTGTVNAESNAERERLEKDVASAEAQLLTARKQLAEKSERLRLASEDSKNASSLEKGARRAEYAARDWVRRAEEKFDLARAQLESKWQAESSSLKPRAGSSGTAPASLPKRADSTTSQGPSHVFRGPSRMAAGKSTMHQGQP